MSCIDLAAVSRFTFAFCLALAASGCGEAAPPVDDWAADGGAASPRDLSSSRIADGSVHGDLAPWRGPEPDDMSEWGASDMPAWGSPDLGLPPGDLGQMGNGNWGNIGVGGGQDFAAFRNALKSGMIPSPDSLDATGFFGEHYTSLPAPACGKAFCLHGMLSVSEDYVRGGDWTLLQMGMNSPLDPAKVKKPPLDVVVVLDHSGSMDGDNKIGFAKDGVRQLIDQLGPDDIFTLVMFDDRVDRLYGPAKVADKAKVKALVDPIRADGSTNIYDALEEGYKAALAGGDETLQRRVIFLTDGVPTSGNSSLAAIQAMSRSYNEKYVGLTAIGLGNDVDAAFLRRLSEQGGGNFYFIEQPAAVMEVFSEELAYFAAPIAYDLEITFDELLIYKVNEVHGTSLWEKMPGGGRIRIPSVFLVSRQSAKANPAPDAGMSAGRRGGGSAIIAELKVWAAMNVMGLHDVAKLHLKYRLPGTKNYETQDAAITFTGLPGKAPQGGYFAQKAVEKNTLVLGFYMAFRDATRLAQSDRPAAKKLLLAVQGRMKARLAGSMDEDLLDDLAILQQYIDVLK